MYRFAATCADSDTVCLDQQQRFRDALSEVRKGADALKKGSEERKKLERSLKKIGEKEGTGATILFDDAGGAYAEANPVKNTITFDLNLVDTRHAPDQHDTFFAGVVAHEGTHLIGRKLGITNFLELLSENVSERSALFTESVFYQGVGRDSKEGLWYESWRDLDALLPQKRNKAIQLVVSRQKQGKASQKKTP